MSKSGFSIIRPAALAIAALALIVTGTAQAQIAEMTSPMPGTTLTGSSATFTWTTGTNVSQYYLYVGSFAGGNDIYGVNQGTSTMATVTNLPTNGSTLYVRLWSFVTVTSADLSQGWHFNDYMYTAFGGSPGCSVPALATMSSPLPGSTLTGASVVFSWSAGCGVTEYYLYVGSLAGGNDIYGADQGTGTTVTVSNLPTNGSTLYVRLWSLLGGVWRFNDYMYTAFGGSGCSAPTLAMMSSPPPGSMLTGASVMFSWTAGCDVSQYYLYVGTMQGGNDIYGTSAGTDRTATVTNLPTDGSTLYVRLWSLVTVASTDLTVGWHFIDYKYTAFGGSSPPALSVTKTADATPVTTGTTIGFTIKVSNAGPGTAFNVQLNDSLSFGPFPWTISPAYAGPGTCSVLLTNTLACSFGNLAAGASATVHIQAPTLAPPRTSAGKYTNSATAFADNEAFPGVTSNSATIVVLSPASPTISKSFGAATIPLNSSTSLSFNLTNPNSIALTGIAFTDNLPAGLLVATPNDLTGSCGGGLITAGAGSGAISLTGATLAAGASCTFSVNVIGITEGVKTNTIAIVTSIEGGDSPAATASLRIASPPTLTKAFADSEIQLLGPSNSTILTFSLTNPNTTTTLTGLAFTDTLPPGLVVSTPDGLTGSCGGGSLTAAEGSSSVGLSGATLAPSASCTFSVNLTSTAIGAVTNTTSTISSNEAVEGAPATASIGVVDLYFQWFFH